MASAWVRLGLPRLVYLLAIAQLFYVARQRAPRAREVGRGHRTVAAPQGRPSGRGRLSPGRRKGTEVEGFKQASEAALLPAWLAWPVETSWSVEPLSPAVESLVPAAALIYGADSAPILAVVVALMRLVAFVTDGHPLGPFLAELLGCQVATLLFYGTGHRPTFEGIQYGAAFVGIDDVSVNRLAHASAFLLTVLNTMGAWLLSALACVSASCPSFPPGRCDAHGPSAPSEKASRDADASSGRGAMMQLVYAVSLAMTSLFVALERRHLMVWAIFAPKLVYEIATALVTNGVLLTAVLSSSLKS